MRHVQTEETYALRAACLDQRASELGATADLLTKAGLRVIQKFGQRRDCCRSVGRVNETLV